MKRVFRIKIHYADGSRNNYDVVAKDDQSARAMAIKKDSADYARAKVKPPRVDYCEITWTADAI